MAICELCEDEMTTGRTCTVSVLHQEGDAFPVAPHRGRRRCGDCGVTPGGFHHPGCDLQVCPACREQLLTCGCRFDEIPSFDHEDDDRDDEEDEEDPPWLVVTLRR